MICKEKTKPLNHHVRVDGFVWSKRTELWLEIGNKPKLINRNGKLDTYTCLINEPEFFQLYLGRAYVGPLYPCVLLWFRACRLPLSFRVNSHSDNHIIVPLSVRQPWRVWVNKSYDAIENDNMTRQDKSNYYSDVMIRGMASQITCVTIIYSTVCSVADLIKHQSSSSLAFWRKSPITGRFPSQRASNAEFFFIWLRHRGNGVHGFIINTIFPNFVKWLIICHLSILHYLSKRQSSSV